MNRIFRLNITLIIGFGSLAATSLHAGYIDTSGNEWRMLTETTDISAETMDTACDDTSFLCSGGITTGAGIIVDVNGWTWASVGEVRTLLSELVPHTFTTADPDYSEVASLWAPSTVALLGQTFNSNTSPGAFGITSSRVDPTYQRLVGVYDYLSPASYDYAFTAGLIHYDFGTTVHGNFMFRGASITEPSALTLLSVGLVGMGFMGRKRAQDKKGDRFKWHLLKLLGMSIYPDFLPRCMPGFDK
ncbi:MAG: hypothetical protein OI74_15810 [Gammaproteobacteria bacterium (ex Lamellibrachia satsuma)]|nr:MAG: hypothetical protein OI74_15810 [Gammaproteobacteria bacterium (ex Lamellibrachia satsuma)]RRS35605.1 MAG: hypothetical protein NV67_10170 [Gammaproteobacteria bacterium (ex Lamellibrachia satsuma)]